MAPNQEKQTAQQVLADFRRKEILEAAVGLTLKSGRQALTMEKVAEKAGVAKGTVYLYFKDKQALIYGLMQHMAKAISEESIRIIQESKGIWNKLFNMLQFAMEKSDEYRELMILLHRTFGDIDACDEEGKGQYEDIFYYMIEELEKARNTGEIQTGITSINICYAYFSMLKGMVLIETHHQENHDDELIDFKQIIDLFCTGIGLRKETKSWY